MDRSKDAESFLLAGLQDESELVRRTVAESLLQIGTVRGLSAILVGSHHGQAVRMKAAFQLASFQKGAGKEAIPNLMGLLQQPGINHRTHFAVVNALQAIGPLAVPAVTTGLLKGSEQTRRYCAIALADMETSPEISLLVERTLKEDGQA